MTIPFPDNSFFDNLKTEALNLKEKSKELFNTAEKANDDPELKELLYEKSYITEQEIANKISLFAMSNLFDSYIDRKENQQYDVTKISISESNYNKMKSFDIEIINLLEFYSIEGVKREIDMLYFISGFKIDKNLNDTEFRLEDHYLTSQDLS